MSVATRTQAELEEMYVGVARLVGYLAVKHCRLYGGDPSEAKSVANESFCQAAHTHDETRGTFHKRCGYKIVHSLWRWQKREVLYRERFVTGTCGKETQRQSDKQWLEDFREDLSC